MPVDFILIRSEIIEYRVRSIAEPCPASVADVFSDLTGISLVIAVASNISLPVIPKRVHCSFGHAISKNRGFGPLRPNATTHVAYAHSWY